MNTMDAMKSAEVLRRNNVCVKGSGQPMLFAHGFGCDQGMWRHVAPAFTEDHQVVLFDHVGAGGSDTKAYTRDKYGTLDGYAADILDICHALDLRGVVYVGHSVSAMIGVLAAIREPERFSRLVLVAPSPRYVHDHDYVGAFGQADIDGLLELLDSNFMAWSSMLGPTIMGNADRPELAAELTSSFCRTDPEIARHFARVTFLSDNRADLQNVRTPSLILQCADDVVAPAAVGEYLHRHLADSRLVHLAATGHCPNLSAPDETTAAIRTYLHA
jgi:sigma-B regulation protein RsbQ